MNLKLVSFLALISIALFSCKSDERAFSQRKYLSGHYFQNLRAKTNPIKNNKALVKKENIDETEAEYPGLVASINNTEELILFNNKPKKGLSTSQTTENQPKNVVKKSFLRKKVKEGRQEIKAIQRAILKPKKPNAPDTERKKESHGTLSFIFTCIMVGSGMTGSIVGLIGLFFAIPAYILGKKSIEIIKADRDSYSNYWMAIVGSIAGGIGVLFLLTFAVIALIYLSVFLLI